MATNERHTSCYARITGRLPVFLVLLLALAAALPALAGPEIAVEPEMLDFGVMQQQVTLDKELTITNIGDAELQLRKVETTCGCTVAKLPTESLQPGESTKLKVSFSSKRYEGPQLKYVRIMSNDPDNRMREVSIAAEVLVPIYTMPVKKQLGFRACGVGVMQKIEMFMETKDIDSLDLSATVKHTDVFKIEFNAHDDPRKKTMVVTLKPTAPAGQYKDVIRIKSNHPEKPEFEIELRARVDADLFASPTELKFRYVQRDQKMRNRVRIRSHAQDIEWKVTKVEFDLPNFTAEIEEKIPNIETFVNIIGTPVSTQHELARENKGRIKGMMRIYTDLESLPMLEVEISYLLRV